MMNDKRVSLKIGAIYTLEQTNGKSKKDFRINREVGRGGSCIVYEAEYRIDEKSEAVKAILKEYYPLDVSDNNYDIKRQPDGMLLINDGSREKFEKKKEKFFEGFYKQIKFQNKNTILSNSIIFGMEKFIANNTEYILMARDEGNSFEECKFSFDNENNNIESNLRNFSLYQTINTIYEFSKIVEQLHKEGFLLLDIKPDNIYVTLKDEVKLFDFDSFKRKDNLLHEAISSSKGWEAPEVKRYLDKLEQGNITGAERELRRTDERADFYSIGQLLSYKIFKRFSQDINYANERIEGLKKYLFENKKYISINYEVFSRLQKFFEKTIDAAINKRYKSDDELVNALEELKNLANPHKRFINYRIENPSDKAGYRDKELEQLHSILQNRSSAFVSAVGGMGKSELAKMYVQKYKDEYDIIQFVDYSESMENTIRRISVNNLEVELMQESNVNYKAINDLLNTQNNNRLLVPKSIDKKIVHYKIVSDLLDVQDNNILLVIENFDKKTSDEDLKKLAERKNIKVIFTTRLKIKEINEGYSDRILDLLPLSEENAEKLFYDFNSKVKEDEKDIVRELIRTVDRNTLVIKLIALQMRKQRTKAAEILNNLKNTSIKNIRGKVYKEQKLYENILSVFDISRLSNDEKLILLKMSLVPFIYNDDILEWLDEEDFDNINNLIELGWINENFDDNKFSLHAMISLVAYEEMYENKWQECESIIGRAAEFIEDIDKLNNLKKRNEIINFAEYSLNRMNKDDLEYAFFYHKYAYMQISLGYYDKALKFGNKSLKIIKERLGENSLEIAASYNVIGIVYARKRKYNETLKFYFKALKIIKERLEENVLEVASLYSNIGEIYKIKEEYDKALEFQFKALKIKKEITGDDSLDTAVSYDEIGETYCSKKEYDKALEFCFKALRIRKETSGISPLDVATSYNCIGEIYRSKEEYDKALEFQFKALKTYKEIVRENFLNISSSYGCIGITYLYTKKYDKALEFQFKALKTYKKIVGENALEVASSYIIIGIIYFYKGEFNKALEFYFKALNTYKEIVGEDSFEVYECYVFIWSIYYQKKEYDKALEFSFKILNIYEKTFFDENYLRAYLRAYNCYMNIAESYFDKKDYNNALKFFNKALTIIEVQGENSKEYIITKRYIELIKIKKNEPSLELANFYLLIGSAFCDDKIKDYINALNFLNEALMIIKKIQGENSELAIRIENIIKNIFLKNKILRQIRDISTEIDNISYFYVKKYLNKKQIL